MTYRTTTHQPMVASIGLPFIPVQLRCQSALDRAKIYLPGFDRTHALGIMPDTYLHRLSEDQHENQARILSAFDGAP